IHLFRRDRPGQRRGVPEIAPALPLFALLRRFTLATLHAAETAASYAGVLYTDDPDNDDESVDAEPGDVIEVEHNSLLVLPNGRKLGQMKAEHPTTNHEMFKREVLREAARCLNLPYNVAAGDSSKYNYASGRLDHQTYDRSIKIEQDYFGAACLDRTFLRWLEEAMTISGYLPEGLPPFAEWNWLWFFDGRPHVDPLKEAAAATSLVNGLLLTEKAYFAERGLDSEEQERQIAAEMGVTVPVLRRLKAVKRFVSGAAQEEMVRELLAMDAAEEAAQEREAADAD
ncbi:MAG TPA: phage portal protein, partial [Planctomycetaceae bacterium]